MLAIRLFTKIEPPDAAWMRRTAERSASAESAGSLGSPRSGIPHAAKSGSPSTGIGNSRSRSDRARP